MKKICHTVFAYFGPQEHEINLQRPNLSQKFNFYLSYAPTLVSKKGWRRIKGKITSQGLAKKGKNSVGRQNKTHK